VHEQRYRLAGRDVPGYGATAQTRDLTAMEVILLVGGRELWRADRHNARGSAEPDDEHARAHGRECAAAQIGQAWPHHRLERPSVRGLDSHGVALDRERRTAQGGLNNAVQASSVLLQPAGDSLPG